MRTIHTTGLLRVPAVVHFPDNTHVKTRAGEQVRLVDFVPMTLNAASIDGDVEPSDYEPAVTEKEVRSTDSLGFGVWTNRWKYVDNPHENRTGLYDLEADPAVQERVDE